MGKEPIRRTNWYKFQRIPDDRVHNDDASSQERLSKSPGIIIHDFEIARARPLPN